MRHNEWMGWIVLIAVIVGLGALLVGITSGDDRYARMSDEEFEKEAQRGSALGAAVMGLQKILEPQRKVETIRQEKTEAESAESGDRPPDGYLPPRKS